MYETGVVVVGALGRDEPVFRLAAVGALVDHLDTVAPHPERDPGAMNHRHPVLERIAAGHEAARGRGCPEIRKLHSFLHPGQQRLVGRLVGPDLSQALVVTVEPATDAKHGRGQQGNDQDNFKEHMLSPMCVSLGFRNETP